MEKYSEDQLVQCHNSAALDESTISNSKLFGCFFCLRTFLPRSVKGYIEGPSYKWAHCPHCGIDAVISDNGTGAIDPQLLVEMKYRYF